MGLEQGVGVSNLKVWRTGIIAGELGGPIFSGYPKVTPQPGLAS